jgi:hypothetical protein
LIFSLTAARDFPQAANGAKSNSVDAASAAPPPQSPSPQPAAAPAKEHKPSVSVKGRSLVTFLFPFGEGLNSQGADPNVNRQHDNELGEERGESGAGSAKNS